MKARWLAPVLLLCACGGAHELAPGARQWNLVVIVLDALPARAVGAWGNPLPVTPNLDRFAAESLRFDDVQASASYTLASVASLFTGLPPATHGVVGLKTNVLVEEHLTLAEALSAAGFVAGGFSSNPHVTPEAGFDQGFERFRHYSRDRLDLHALPAGFVDDALAWWRERAGRRRFLYVHCLPPHQPYDPPPPHDRLFGADATERREGLTDFLVALDDQPPVDPDEARRIRARYLAGLHYADACLGELLDALRADGAFEDTLIAVTSDHGEAFGEHGRLLHGSTVFGEMVQVPLALHWPGVEPGEVRGLVRLRDLTATFCDVLGASWPRDGERGTSLLDALRGGAPPDTPAVARSVGDRPVWALRTPEWSLIRHQQSGSLLLFDRRRDPEEQADLAQREARVAAELGQRLTRELERQRRSPLRPSSARGDRTHMEEIEKLGYTEED